MSKSGLEVSELCFGTLTLGIMQANLYFVHPTDFYFVKDNSKHPEQKNPQEEYTHRFEHIVSVLKEDYLEFYTNSLPVVFWSSHFFSYQVRQLPPHTLKLFLG